MSVDKSKIGGGMGGSCSPISRGMGGGGLDMSVPRGVGGDSPTSVNLVIRR